MLLTRLRLTINLHLFGGFVGTVTAQVIRGHVVHVMEGAILPAGHVKGMV